MPLPTGSATTLLQRNRKPRSCDLWICERQGSQHRAGPAGRRCCWSASLHAPCRAAYAARHAPVFALPGRPSGVSGSNAHRCHNAPAPLGAPPLRHCLGCLRARQWPQWAHVGRGGRPTACRHCLAWRLRQMAHKPGAGMRLSRKSMQSIDFQQEKRKPFNHLQIVPHYMWTSHVMLCYGLSHGTKDIGPLPATASPATA